MDLTTEPTDDESGTRDKGVKMARDINVYIAMRSDFYNNPQDRYDNVHGDGAFARNFKNVGSIKDIPGFDAKHSQGIYQDVYGVRPAPWIIDLLEAKGKSIKHA